MVGKIMMIEALDHFSTEFVEEDEVIARFIGEFIGEDDNYISLRHVKADINNEDSVEEVHKVLKKVIVRKEEFEL